MPEATAPPHARRPTFPALRLPRMSPAEMVTRTTAPVPYPHPQATTTTATPTRMLSATGTRVVKATSSRIAASSSQGIIRRRQALAASLTMALLGVPDVRGAARRRPARRMRRTWRASSRTSVTSSRTV